MIEIPQWGNVTLVELLWLSSGLIALVVSVLRLPVLIRDFTYALDRADDDLCVIARGYLRRELVRVLQAGAVIAVGIYAALQPPLIPGPARISLVGVWLTFTLISISLLIAVQSILDWRDREKVQGIIERSP